MTEPDTDLDTDSGEFEDETDEYLMEDIEPDMQLLPPERVIRPGVGMTTALLMSLVAAIAGALGGAAIAEVIRYKSTDDINNIQSELTTLSSEREALSAQLSRTQAQVQSLSMKKPTDLSRIESRLKTLETQRQPNLKQLESRLESLETQSQAPREKHMGTADTATGSTSSTSDLAARVEILERRSSPYDMTDILERLDRLEVQSVTPRSMPMARAKPLVKTIIIPPLPRAEILGAIEQQDKESRSWLGRTLRKHVSIREAGSESPEAVLNEIQAAIDVGNYAAALDAFEKLPSRARSEAADWQKAVKTKLEESP